MVRSTALGWLGLLAAMTACGGGSDLLLPGSGEPAAVTMLQGDQQNGRVGEPLPQPLVAVVTDASGRPVEGATVRFVLTDPAPGASVAPDTTTTDGEGHATANVVLGTRTGVQAGDVQALGADGSVAAHVGFTLTALSENASSITAVGGLDQSGLIGTTLASPLVVQITDAFGNPTEGVTVTWTVDGGGAVSASTTTTGSDGTTSVQRTLGTTAGTQRTFATVEGLVGSPVTFVHRATAGAASGVTIVAGNGQTGPVSTELPQDLVVEVRDASSNPVPSVAVTWVIGAGGGRITPTTSITDASGRASAAWTLGPTPGANNNTVSAVVSGIGVAQFTATATGGAPSRLSIVTQPSASAVSGVPFDQQPVIQLLDGSGNEVRQGGVAVSVAIASGGGSLSGATSVGTDGNGRASFSGLALSGSAGTRTLRFSASGFASVTSQAISLGASPTTTTITSDQPDPSALGVDVTVRFTVTAASGTPTGSVTVQDVGDTCSGTLSGGQGSCIIRLTNTGSRTLTASYAGAEGFAPSSDTEEHTVEAPPPPALAIATQPGATATSGAALSPQPVIQLKNGDGSDQATAGVQVTAAASGPGTLSGTTSVSTDAAGRATFTDLVITGAGTYTLAFTATGYTSVTSGTIEVQAAPPPPPSATLSTITVDPSIIAVGGTSTITVTVRDGSGAPLGGRSVTVSSSGTGDAIANSSSGNNTGTTGSDGVVTFTFSSSVAEVKTISAVADQVPLATTPTITVQ